MITIHKYPLKIRDFQDLQLPSGAEILHVGRQTVDLYLWAKVDTDRLHVTRIIRIYGTGHPITSSLNLIHLGTVAIDPYVWHVFEERP